MSGPARTICVNCMKFISAADARYAAHREGPCHWQCWEGECQAKAEQFIQDLRIVAAFLYGIRGDDDYMRLLECNKAIDALARVSKVEIKT